MKQMFRLESIWLMALVVLYSVSVLKELTGQEDSLEENMVTHPSILAWKSRWTYEPGGLQSIELQRVGHDWIDLARLQP